MKNKEKYDTIRSLYEISKIKRIPIPHNAPFPPGIFVARNKTPGYSITGAIQYQSLQGLFSILFVFLLKLFTPVTNFRQSASV